MPTNLAVQPSASPLPTGDCKRIFGQGSAGAVAWPGAWMYADAAQTIPMQVGPWRKPYRFWLVACANLIMYCGAGWTRADFKLQLATEAVQTTDLNGIGFFQAITVRDNEGGVWQGYQAHGRFYCEAYINYYVQLLSTGAVANVYYYAGADVHLSLYGYSVGEGVY